MTGINIPLQAVRWFKPGDHPEVFQAGPRLVRSIDGKLGYVSGIHPLPCGWLSLDKIPTKPIDVNNSLFSPMAVGYDGNGGEHFYYRRYYPFNFWDIKASDTTAPSKDEQILPEDDEFLRDFLDAERAADLPFHKPKDWDGVYRACGWLLPNAGDGRVIVYPGDWVVTAPVRVVLSDEAFRLHYGNDIGEDK